MSSHPQGGLKMHRFFAIALSSTLLIGAFANAQETPQSYVGFTIDQVTRNGDTYTGPVLSPLSNSNGVALFSLDAVKNQQYIELGESGYTEELGRLDFTVTPGYKIVGLVVSGDLSGSLQIYDASHVPGLIHQSIGYASNNVRIQLDIVDYGSPNLWLRSDNAGTWSHIEEQTTFSFGLTGEWTGQFALSSQFWTSISTEETRYQAEYGGRWWEGMISTYAGVRINNPILSVRYQPITEVPEPDSWIMFLGGLVPVALLSRRRSRASPRHGANAA